MNEWSLTKVRPEPDTLPPTTLPKDDIGWTFGDAEKAYKKYTDIVDEYKWPIEDLDGKDWVPLLNAGDTVLKLKGIIETLKNVVQGGNLGW